MGNLRVLTPEETSRMFELAEKPYRPKEITDLKEQIEAKTRLAEFRFSVNGLIDHELIQEIVKMKLELDALYGDWIDGKIA